MLMKLKQKKNKNYLEIKINYNIYTHVSYFFKKKVGVRYIYVFTVQPGKP